MVTPATPLRVRAAEALLCKGDEAMSQGSAANEESRVTPAVYGELDAAPPEVRREIVLGLIREHPEGRLVLPGRDGVRAMLDGIALPRLTPGPGGDRATEPDPRRANGRLALHLRGANLRGASLRAADLRGIDLEEADLRETDLDGADLRGATLRHADLSHSRLVRANLGGANLAGADLRGALLEGAELGGADLANAR